MGLGTLGLFLWLCIGWWHLGWFWATDTHWAWLIALGLVGFFLVLICTPIQFAARKIRSDAVAYALGIISGPIAVIAYLVLHTRFEPTFSNYIVRQISMHALFAILGLLFAISYRRRFGPNNSFKPTPLRGAA